MQNQLGTSLFGLLITVVVVFRFAIRELKPRVVKGGVLWIRPILLAAVTLWLAWLTITVDPAGIGQLIGALLVGGVLGAITGILIIRYTTFYAPGIPNAVLVSGSKVTFGIWVCAFAIRFLARYVIPHGADPRTQLPLNSGVVALAMVAFVVIAFAFHRAIDRYGSAAPIAATR
jgi:hypothetical protein